MQGYKAVASQHYRGIPSDQAGQVYFHYTHFASLLRDHEQQNMLDGRDPLDKNHRIRICIDL